jgi:hypothetical protein
MLSKLAYLTLCRSIQLLALAARGDAAKDLEIVVLRHQLRSCVARSRVPGWNRPTGPCSPRSAASCPEPAGPASALVAQERDDVFGEDRGNEVDRDVLLTLDDHDVRVG